MYPASVDPYYHTLSDRSKDAGHSPSQYAAMRDHEVWLNLPQIVVKGVWGMDRKESVLSLQRRGSRWTGVG